MNRTRRYEFEGVVLDIPIHYDEGAGIYIEDYPDFSENPVWTKAGHRVMFAGEDACSDAIEKTEGGCPDCGCCKYYKSAGEHTWFGICTHEMKRKAVYREEAREAEGL